MSERAVICTGCDFILETNFLGGDILDEEKSLRPGAGGVAAAKFNLADAVILGNISEDTSSFDTSDSGFHLMQARQARVYVSGRSQALMAPDAVPQIVVADWDRLLLTPFERHILRFIDGHRPVDVIHRRAGLDETEVKTALATLADKGVVRVVGRALADLSNDVQTAPQGRVHERRRLQGTMVGAVVMIGDAADHAIDAAFRTQVFVGPAGLADRDDSDAKDNESVFSSEDIAVPNKGTRPNTRSAIDRIDDIDDDDEWEAPTQSRADLRHPPTWAPAGSSQVLVAPAASTSSHHRPQLSLPSLPSLPPLSGPLDPELNSDSEEGPTLGGRGPQHAAFDGLEDFSAPNLADLADSRVDNRRFVDEALAALGVRPTDSPSAPRLTGLRGGGLVDPDSLAEERAQHGSVWDSQGLASAVAGDERSLPDRDERTRAQPMPPPMMAPKRRLAVGGPPPLISGFAEATPAVVLPMSSQPSLPDPMEDPDSWSSPGRPGMSSLSGDELADDPADPSDDGSFEPATANARRAKQPIPASSSDQPMLSDIEPSSGEAWSVPPLRKLGNPLVGPAYSATTDLGATGVVSALPLLSRGSPSETGEQSWPVARPLASDVADHDPEATQHLAPRPPPPPLVDPSSREDSTGDSAPVVRVPTVEVQARARGLYEEALRQHKLGQIGQARMNMRLASIQAPGEPKYRQLLAEWDRASRTRPSSALEPESSSGEPEYVRLWELSQQLEASGDVDGALAALRRGAPLAPRRAQFHNRIGVLLAVKSHDYDRAAAEIRLAIALDPQNLHYRNNLGKVLETARAARKRDRQAEL